MAATTNEEGWASDTTGNRRYWPVRVGACDTEGLAKAREQIWAEARVAFEAGQSWWLDRAETMLAAREQAERVPEDPWLADLLALVEGRYKHDEWISSATLLEALGVPQTARHTGTGRRLSAQMKALDWCQGYRRVGGRLCRVWVRQPPDTDGVRVGTDAEVIPLCQPPLRIDTKIPSTDTDDTDRERERERERKEGGDKHGGSR